MEIILNSLRSFFRGKRLNRIAAKCKRYQEAKKGGKEVEEFSAKIKERGSECVEKLNNLNENFNLHFVLYYMYLWIMKRNSHLVRSDISACKTLIVKQKVKNKQGNVLSNLLTAAVLLFSSPH